MKKLVFIFFIGLGLFTSCVKNPEENPDPLAPAGNLTAKFDDQTFESDSTTVVIDAVSMSIKAKQLDGSYFKITLPESPIIGTYSWAEGFTLQYNKGDGTDSYVAQKDEGVFASFPNYTDTAVLVIVAIDKTNKRISGTFKFTGVRFTDDTHTAIETKVFTNGEFLNLPYTAVNPNATVLVKKITVTDADNTVGTIEYFYTEDNKMDYTIDGDGNRTDYIYNGNLLKEENTYLGTSTTLIEKSTYAYNASSKLETYVNIDLVVDEGTKITYTHNSDGTIDYQEYSGDSSSQDVVGSSGTLSITRHIENYTDPFTLESQVYTGEFTYDDKNNPFKNVIGYNKVYFADSGESLNFANNITKYTDQIDANPSYIVETMTYTYDSDNYPTQIVHRHGDGTLDYTEDIIYY
jgi:Family of unknown function (DUF6252)